MKLRYTIPWALVEEVMAWLQDEATEAGTKVAVMGDDGEKFGLWPGTYQHVWGGESKTGGWMEQFFEALEENATWVETIPPGEYIRRFSALGRIYLPTASYDEMTEWALPAKLSGEIVSLKHQLKDEKRTDVLRFVRGGFWRYFMVKYPEVNTMHKKMLRVSEKVHSLKREADGTVAPVGNSGDHLGEALDELWAAQCNCPYWHGVFGGIYLPHLRQAAYRHLIEAEKRLPAEEGWSFEDYDSDGRPEAVYRGPAHSLFLKPSQGGTLVSLDSLRLCRNMLDVLSRRREAYHLHKSEDSGKGKSIHELDRPLPAGSERLFQYDLRPRYSLRDRFLEPGTAPESFVQGLEPEAGDFADGEYDFRPAKPRGTRADRQGVRELRLRRSGIIRLWGREFPLRLEKKIRAAKDGFEVGFELRNLGRDGLEFLFGSEWNFSAFPGEWEVEPGRAILRLFARSVSLEAPGAQGIWEHPLQTLSQSEKGYDIIHQGICCLVVWKVHLAGSGAWTSRLALREKSRG
jgi:hypothetical protein